MKYWELSKQGMWKKKPAEDVQHLGIEKDPYYSLANYAKNAKWILREHV